jgi:UTP--glucose-1-phosphate uridylyltransferase
MRKLLLVLCGIMFCAIDSTLPRNQIIVPMAGLGTRLLPLTKTTQKSMVRLVDRPALHQIVDEALRSNISDFCFVVNEHDQETITQYFSLDSQLDALLAERGKSYLLDQLNDVIRRSTFTYIVQPQPMGTGDAVLMAEKFVEPGSFFSVMFPDDIIETAEPHLARIMALAREYDATVITVQEMTRQQASIYAVVTPGSFLSDDLMEVVDIIEKPISTETSLCFVPMGRYVFSYDIFESLRAIEPAINGEYQLTDAIQHLVKNGKRVLAYKIQGTWHDIGNIRGLLKTTVSLGLHNPLYRDMLCTIFEKEMQVSARNK